MILISVFRQREIEARLGDARKKAPKIIARALNRAIENTRTNVVAKAREEYHIKASDVRSTIRVSKATPSNLRAVVESKDTGRELSQFKVRPGSTRYKKPPKVVKVAIKKAGGFKNLPGEFVARGNSSGKLHVLKRVTSKRYPINIKYGPSIPQMVGQPKVKWYVEREARVMFEKRLEHEMNRVLEGN